MSIVKGQPVELSPVNRVVALIFGALCLAMGLGMFISGIKNNLYGYWRTRTGVTVEARLSYVDRRVSTGAKGGSVWTDVSYDYQVGGKWFTATRVTLFKTTAQYYRPLKAALDADQPIRIFIDPAHPQFAVIDRDFSLFPFVIAVPFSLTFVGIGLFIGWCLLVNYQGKAIPLKTVRAPVKTSCRPKRSAPEADGRRNG